MQPVGQRRAAPQDADNRNLRATGQQPRCLAGHVGDDGVKLLGV